MLSQNLTALDENLTKEDTMKIFALLSCIAAGVMSVQQQQYQANTDVLLQGSILAEPKSTRFYECFNECKKSVNFPRDLPDTIRDVMEDLAKNSTPWTWNHLTYHVRHEQKGNDATQIFEAELINCANTCDGKFECDLGKYRNNIYSFYAVPDGHCISNKPTRNPKRIKQLYFYPWDLPQTFELRCENGTTNLKLFVMKMTCQNYVSEYSC